MKKNGSFMDMVVPGAEEARHPWVAYTEENYQRLVQTALSGTTHPAKNKKCKTTTSGSSSSTSSSHTPAYP